MKIILLQDVAKVGRKYEVKIVADGFSRNNLIPRGLAWPATPANISRIAELKKPTVEKQTAENVDFDKLIQLIKEEAPIIKQKANDAGHLFAGLHEKDITEILSKKFNQRVNPDWIKIEKPLKTVGEHEIVLNLKDKQISIKLMIEKI